MPQSITQEQVLAALRNIQDPDLHQDIVSLGFVQNLQVQDSRVHFDIMLTTPACPVREEMRQEAEKVVKALPGIDSVQVQMTARVTSGQSSVRENYIPQVRNTIAVSSGKGGVGKTTVSVNLAVTLAGTGARVGLLDADIYGPNVPLMMGVKHSPATLQENRPEKIQPALNYKVKVMSIGFFVPEEAPIIWRGPMIHGAIQQFLLDVDWGELDYLIVDLPPGTGDAQLSISQLVPMTGAIIVTTPQEVALLDSRKGLAMLQKLHVPVLGIIENMSTFSCPHCNKRTDIFHHGGGRKVSEKMGVPFLGEIPLETSVRIGGDQGCPIVVSDPKSPIAEAYQTVAGALAAQISIHNAQSIPLRVIP